MKISILATFMCSLSVIFLFSNCESNKTSFTWEGTPYIVEKISFSDTIELNHKIQRIVDTSTAWLVIDYYNKNTSDVGTSKNSQPLSTIEVLDENGKKHEAMLVYIRIKSGQFSKGDANRNITYALVFAPVRRTSKHFKLHVDKQTINLNL